MTRDEGDKRPLSIFSKMSVNIDKTRQLHRQKANFAFHNTDLIFLIFLNGYTSL
jgi:hypothetical protein